MGRRVLINVPKKKESVIELSAKDEESIMQEAMQEWLKLEVYAVGSSVEGLAPGNKVYIAPDSLQRAEKVKIDGDVKLMVSEGDIAIIW
jgi:hypothetical protein